MIAKDPNGVVAVLSGGTQTDAALAALRDSGFDMRSVVVVNRNRTDAELPELDHRPKHLAEVAVYWGRGGAILGAGIGLAVVAIPAIAAVVGLGTFEAAILFVPPLLALGLGLLAASIGLGAHLAHSLAYARAIRRGKNVLVAHTDDRDSLTDIKLTLANLGAERIDVHGLRTA